MVKGLEKHQGKKRAEKTNEQKKRERAKFLKKEDPKRKSSKGTEKIVRGVINHF